MRVFAIFLLGISILKIGIFSWIGPSTSPDTAAYVGFADAILNHGQAFAPMHWGTVAAPPLIFRLAGYPLILAGAKLLSPLHWTALVVGFQGCLTIIVLMLIFAVARKVFQSVAAAMAVVILYGLSASILWDNSLLSDSVYSSLFNIVLFALIGHRINCWRLSFLGCAGMGFLCGYSTLTRDSGLYFALLPAIPLIAAARSGGRFVPRELLRLAIFILIVVSMVGAYVMLNKYRTGEAFFSITGIENWLRPVFDMANDRYARPFGGADLVSRTVRDTKTPYDYLSQLAFLDVLHQRCGCTPTQLQAIVFSTYLATVSHHPWAYAGVIINNFDFLGLASDLTDPIKTLNMFTELGTPIGHRVIPTLSVRHLLDLRHHFSVVVLILMSLSVVTGFTSAVLFALFLFGVPWRLAKAGWPHGAAIGEDLPIIAFLYFSFMLVSIAFSMVHFEARHALPVFPAAQFGIVWMARWARQHLRKISILCLNRPARYSNP